MDSLLAQSFGIYAPLVASVSETGNPEGLRNKIVTDFKGRAYAIDFYGNAKILIDTLAYATNAALADSNAASRIYIDIKTSQTLNAAVRTANSYTDTAFCSITQIRRIKQP